MLGQQFIRIYTLVDVTFGVTWTVQIKRDGELASDGEEDSIFFFTSISRNETISADNSALLEFLKYCILVTEAQPACTGERKRITIFAMTNRYCQFEWK